MAFVPSDIGNVTIKQLRVFVSVVLEKTFTGAANILHVTLIAPRDHCCVTIDAFCYER